MIDLDLPFDRADLGQICTEYASYVVSNRIKFQVTLNLYFQGHVVMQGLILGT